MPTRTPGAPKLEVSVAAWPDPVGPGGEITYVYSYANRGTAAAHGVVLEGVTPPSTTFRSASLLLAESPARGQPGEWLLSIGELPRDSWGYLMLVVRVDAETSSGTTIVDDAYLLSAHEPSISATGPASVVRVVAESPIAFGVQSLVDPVRAGVQFGYEMLVSNPGVVAAHDVVVSQDSRSGPIILSSVPPPDPGTSYRWSFGDLAPGAVGRISVTAVTPPFSDAVIVHQEATATAAGPWQSTASWDVVAGTPSVTVSLDAPLQVRRGAVVHYRVHYLNETDAAVLRATVTLRYDPALTFVRALPRSDAATNDHWTLGPLKAGASGTIDIDMTVDGSAPIGALLGTAAVLEVGRPYPSLVRATTVVVR